MPESGSTEILLQRCPFIRLSNATTATLTTTISCSTSSAGTTSSPSTNDSKPTTSDPTGSCQFGCLAEVLLTKVCSFLPLSAFAVSLPLINYHWWHQSQSELVWRRLYQLHYGHLTRPLSRLLSVAPTVTPVDADHQNHTQSHRHRHHQPSEGVVIAETAAAFAPSAFVLSASSGPTTTSTGSATSCQLCRRGAGGVWRLRFAVEYRIAARWHADSPSSSERRTEVDTQVTAILVIDDDHDWSDDRQSLLFVGYCDGTIEVYDWKECVAPFPDVLPERYATPDSLVPSFTSVLVSSVPSCSTSSSSSSSSLAAAASPPSASACSSLSSAVPPRFSQHQFRGSRRLRPLRTLNDSVAAHSVHVIAFQYHRRSHILVSGCVDGTIGLWDIHTARCLHRLSMKPTGSDLHHRLGRRALCGLLMDEHHLAAAAPSGVIMVWSVDWYKQRATHRTHALLRAQTTMAATTMPPKTTNILDFAALDLPTKITSAISPTPITPATITTRSQSDIVEDIEPQPFATVVASSSFTSSSSSCPPPRRRLFRGPAPLLTHHWSTPFSDIDTIAWDANILLVTAGSGHWWAKLDQAAKHSATAGTDSKNLPRGANGIASGADSDGGGGSNSDAAVLAVYARRTSALGGFEAVATTHDESEDETGPHAAAAEDRYRRLPASSSSASSGLPAYVLAWLHTGAHGRWSGPISSVYMDEGSGVVLTLAADRTLGVWRRSCTGTAITTIVHVDSSSPSSSSAAESSPRHAASRSWPCRPLQLVAFGNIDDDFDDGGEQQRALPQPSLSLQNPQKLLQQKEPKTVSIPPYVMAVHPICGADKDRSRSQQRARPCAPPWPPGHLTVASSRSSSSSSSSSSSNNDESISSTTSLGRHYRVVLHPRRGNGGVRVYKLIVPSEPIPADDDLPTNPILGAHLPRPLLRRCGSTPGPTSHSSASSSVPFQLARPTPPQCVVATYVDDYQLAVVDYVGRVQVMNMAF